MQEIRKAALKTCALRTIIINLMNSNTTTTATTKQRGKPPNPPAMIPPVTTHPTKAPPLFKTQEDLVDHYQNVKREKKEKQRERNRCYYAHLRQNGQYDKYKPGNKERAKQWYMKLSAMAKENGVTVRVMAKILRENKATEKKHKMTMSGEVTSGKTMDGNTKCIQNTTTTVRLNDTAA